MILRWHEKAWEDYLYYQANDKAIVKRINEIIKAINRNGYDIAYNIEPLRGNLSGFYSARIDKKNRLVFRIENDSIEIAMCGRHYDNK